MSPSRIVLVVIAVASAIAVAGCGGQARDPQPPSAPARATTLDGVYLAKLDRRALARIRPPEHVPAGWWTLLVDSASHRLVLSHPRSGAFTERLTAVDGSQIRLAPSVACEQHGLGRTQPSRLAWLTTSTRFRFESIDVPAFTSGTYLRFRALDVPCLTTNVLLTSTVWQKA